MDPRRPFRLLHLDLLVLLGFGVSHVYFNRGDIETSVPLVYPVLLYLLVRTALAGLRPRERPRRLVPLAPAWLLVVGLVFLLSFRIGLNVVDSNVIDVGYAGVIGADRVVDGDQLYGDGFSRDVERGDTYGPLNYLAYVPFEQALPWSGRWDDLPAAHGAAIAFDLLVVAGLLLLGPAAPPGAGRTSCSGWRWPTPGPPIPYTAFALETNSDDALVALACVAALLALTIRPARSRLAAAARGAAVAAGAAAKFAPLALAPLFAVYPARGRSRAVVFALALAAVLALSVIPFVPDGGLRELYDRTIGYQVVAPVAVQHLGPARSIGWLHTVAKAARGWPGARGRVRPARARAAADGRPRGGGADRPPAGGDALVLPLRGLVRPVRAGGLPRRLPEPRRAGAGAVRGARAGGRPRLRRLVAPALALLALGWAATLWVPPFCDDSVNDLYVYRTFAAAGARRRSCPTATCSSSTRRSRRR